MKKHRMPPQHSNQPGTPQGASVIPKNGLTLQGALALLDLTTSPFTWRVGTNAISQADLQVIGQCFFDGLDSALSTHDTAAFMLCCRALRECLCYDLEEHRLRVKIPNSNVVAVMPLFQTAAFMGQLDICEQLFDYALTLPAHPLRSGLDCPFSMVSHALRENARKNTPEWAALETHVITEFVDLLAQTHPEQLQPGVGMLFDSKFAAKVGPGMSKVHQALVNKHATLIAAELPSPTSSMKSPTKRL